MSENMSAAPTLQRVLSMKSIIVGLLAVFALTGCGVGMDDPEAQQAATGKTTAQLVADREDNAAAGQAELRRPVNQAPAPALPQDPIPIYNSKTIHGAEPLPAR